jgi:Flp pilus assembly protein TadG
MTRMFRYGQVTGFASQDEGVAAVEFALMLPVMLALFVGVTQVGEAVSISHKVTVTARTVTDLITREYSPLSQAELTLDLEAAVQVMAPYPSSNVNVTVSEITTDSNSNATVLWSGSWPNNANALVAGSAFTLPSTLSGANITVIYGQVTYSYTPVIGYNIIGPIALSDGIYLYPRTTSCIAGPNSATYPCPATP